MAKLALAEDQKLRLKELSAIVKAFKEFYPEDRIDIQASDSIILKALENGYDSFTDAENSDLYSAVLENGIEVQIIVHYDSIELTNDAGNKYTIYDVYVKHKFPYTHLSLTRASYTRKEIARGYVHSHVPKGGFTDFRDFCLGSSDTPVNIARANIRRALIDDDLDSIGLLTNIYIIQVERTLKIESNEGVPHISFTAVTSDYNKSPLEVTPDLNFAITSDSIRTRMKKFIIYYSSLRLDDFYYDGKNWQLKASDAEFITRVTKVAEKSKIILNSMYEEVYYIGGLYYYKKNQRYYGLNENAHMAFNFKGERPALKIIADNSDEKYYNVRILELRYINLIYRYLTTLINSVYAIQSKDNFRSRAHKIKTYLLKTL